MRLVQINTEELQLVLAMNRLRHAYLIIAPGLGPFFTRSPGASRGALVAGGVVRSWWSGDVVPLQRHTLDPRCREKPSFPTPL